MTPSSTFYLAAVSTLGAAATHLGQDFLQQQRSATVGDDTHVEVQTAVSWTACMAIAAPSSSVFSWLFPRYGSNDCFLSLRLFVIANCESAKNISSSMTARRKGGDPPWCRCWWRRRVSHGAAAVQAAGLLQATITQDVCVRLGAETFRLIGCGELYILCNAVNSWSQLLLPLLVCFTANISLLLVKATGKNKTNK